VRIALVAPLVTPISEPQGGGSQAFLADLARGLTGRGHEVHLYAAAGSRVSGVTVIDTGIDPALLAGTLYRADGSAGQGPASDQERAGPGPAVTAFARAYAQLRLHEYDVIHNHAFDAPAIDLATGLGAPVVHTLHLPPDPAVARALRRAAGQAGSPAVACVSQAQAAAWRAAVQVDAILPPYVPARSIPWSAASGQGAVFAGRLSPEKGAAEAIDIATAAGLRIDVYGDAYDPAYAREQIEPRHDPPRVTIRPGVPRRAIWTAMAQAAVVLCPSRWDEPFGMAAADAQACGTPVIAFRRGGLAEVIEDGVTGYLVAPGDVAAAAASSRAALRLSRAACRDHAVRHLDLERSLDGHHELYRRLADAARAPAAG
jgi:UDP-glucose:tetrahydrobiopterin glucosyltransferase